MIRIKGRRRCEGCGKRYNYYYAKGEDSSKIKYKGKDENANLATEVKILSMRSYEVTVNCPECQKQETFVYTE